MCNPHNDIYLSLQIRSQKPHSFAMNPMSTFHRTGFTWIESGDLCVGNRCSELSGTLRTRRSDDGEVEDVVVNVVPVNEVSDDGCEHRMNLKMLSI
jgi:hypothetical protein